MATTTKKKAAPSAAAEKPVEEAAVETKKSTERKFKDSDLLPCLSITGGELFVIGEKSNTLYVWSGEGDVVDVEYRDIVAAMRGGKTYIYNPNFIVQDDDFVKQNKDIAKLYESLWTAQNLRDILALSPTDMRHCVEKLPNGAKESLKSIAMSAVNDGSLDSIKKVKILDDIFHTDMMIRLAQ